MTVDPLKSMLGTGKDAIVEIDETFVGGKVANNKHRDRTAKVGQKTIVMTLVDRDGDAVGVVVPDTKKETLESDREANRRPFRHDHDGWKSELREPG
jgi:ISXO2-like transposase domain